MGHYVAVDLGFRVRINVHLGDLLPKLGLDHVRVLLRLLADKDLRRRDVRQLEYLLVRVAPNASVVEVEEAAERADGEGRAVVLPAHGGDGVHVLDDLDLVLVPRVGLGVVAEGIETVEVSDGHAVAGVVEGGHGELLALGHSLGGLSAVVKGALPTPIAVVEGDDLIVSCSADTTTPRQGVRDRGVRTYLGVRGPGHVRVGKVVAEYGAVEVRRDDPRAVGGGGQGDNVGFRVVQSLGLVGPKLPDLDLALGQTINHLEGVVHWPNQGSHRGRPGELVADGLLPFPDGIRSAGPLVHEDDVVRLGNGELGLGRVRAEAHGTDEVILGTLVVWLGGELVHALAVLVVYRYDSVSGDYCHA
mmetsp:Transcript_13363/g.27397  ORF Transcript_13363/g.27397 Transcript_13363/m.27397 type:complete len:360 (+) Transcript_13363:4175-5254(+)